MIFHVVVQKVLHEIRFCLTRRKSMLLKHFHFEKFDVEVIKKGRRVECTFNLKTHRFVGEGKFTSPRQAVFDWFWSEVSIAFERSLNMKFGFSKSLVDLLPIGESIKNSFSFYALPDGLALILKTKFWFLAVSENDYVIHYSLYIYIPLRVPTHFGGRGAKFPHNIINSNLSCVRIFKTG